MERICVGPACQRPSRVKGMCSGHYAQAKRGDALSPLRPRSSAGRTCEVCGVEFVAKMAEQRACGRECGRFVQFGWPVSTLAWRTCAVCSRPYTTRGKRRCGCTGYYARRTGTTRIAQCRYCTLPIEYVVTGCGGKALVCDTCKRERAKALRAQRNRLFGKTYRSRARAYGVEYEPVNRIKVFSRDGWRCQLCGKPVKRDAKAPDPLSPSIDHVIPMSVGGPHTYANTQCAHFLCNSLKGNRGSQQLALVG